MAYELGRGAAIIRRVRHHPRLDAPRRAGQVRARLLRQQRSHIADTRRPSARKSRRAIDSLGWQGTSYHAGAWARREVVGRRAARHHAYRTSRGPFSVRGRAGGPSGRLRHRCVMQRNPDPWYRRLPSKSVRLESRPIPPIERVQPSSKRSPTTPLTPTYRALPKQRRAPRSSDACTDDRQSETLSPFR